MTQKRTLIYLSNCAVDKRGVPDSFMMQELPWLLAHFDRVLLVCHDGRMEFAGARDLEKPRFPVRGGSFAWLRAFGTLPFEKEAWRELGRMRKAGCLSPVNGVKLLLFTARGKRMHVWLEEMLKTCDLASTTLYSFWMSFDAYAGAMSKRKHPQLALKIRGHAFDIDVDRNPMNPYLMKRFIAGQADGMYLISRRAKAQYLRYMEGVVAPGKLHVAGMGSGGQPVEERKGPPFFTDGVLRLVSCAAMNPIKQVPLLIDALAAWTGGKLHWLHIGGGPQEEAVGAYAVEKLKGHEQVTYEMAGALENAQVQAVYETQAFDVFVNTSRMEGVPVSIMEAMRVGIPVIAPRVGGIPELVTENMGILYSPEEGAKGVKEALEAFAALPLEKVQAMRQASRERWMNMCRSEALLPLVFPQEEGRGGEESHG